MLKIEKKISFIVAGIEFQNLKTAQFFARYVDNIRKSCDDQNKPEFSVKIILEEMYRLVSADSVNTDEELTEVVMGLQMPKPARKPKEIQKCMKPDDTEFEMIPDNSMPGIYGKDDTIG